MAGTVMSELGEIVIPQEILDRHGWTTGTVLVVEDLGGGAVGLKRADQQPVEDGAPVSGGERDDRAVPNEPG